MDSAAVEIAKRLLESTRKLLEDNLRPVLDRVRAVEQRVAALKDGEPGKDAEVDYDRVEQRIAELVAALPKPENGKNAEVDYDQVAVTIREAVAALPVPAAAEVDYDKVHEIVTDIVAEAVALLPKPKDGESAEVDYDRVEQLVRTTVAAVPLPPAQEVDYRRVEQAIRAVVAELPKPKDGKDATEVDYEQVNATLREMVEGIQPPAAEAVDYARVAATVRELLAALPQPKNGKDAEEVDYERVAAAIRDAVAAEVKDVVAALPKPKNGKDADEVDYDRVLRYVREVVGQLPPPENGKDAEVDYDKVEQMVVAIYAANPPKDGKDVEMEVVARLVQQTVDRAVEALPAPKDGRSAFDLAVAHGFSGTEPQWLASLVGKPGLSKGGEPGTKGKDADPVVMAAMVRTEVAAAVAALPKPRDGRDVTDPEAIARAVNAAMEKVLSTLRVEALPGAGQTEFDGRNFVLRATIGTVVVDAPFYTPTQLHRGVWQEGRYERADAVTLSGSQWTCVVDETTERPGQGCKDWVLVVKHGRDGRDLRPEQDNGGGRGSRGDGVVRLG